MEGTEDIGLRADGLRLYMNKINLRFNKICVFLLLYRPNWKDILQYKKYYGV
jgi:hypothetical protein